jgi:hypothetical protein
MERFRPCRCHAAVEYSEQAELEWFGLRQLGEFFKESQRRKPMTRVVLAVAMIVLVGSALPAELTAAPKTDQVRAEGCVEAGVEAGCLVVKDVKSGTLYNLRIKGPRPQVGEGIDFVGVPFDGVSICMQGPVVDVIKWAPKESLKCTQGEAPRK